METLIHYKEGKAEKFNNILMKNKTDIIAVAIKGKWHLMWTTRLKYLYCKLLYAKLFLNFLNRSRCFRKGKLVFELEKFIF